MTQIRTKIVTKPQNDCVLIGEKCIANDVKSNKNTGLTKEMAFMFIVKDGFMKAIEQYSSKCNSTKLEKLAKAKGEDNFECKELHIGNFRGYPS